MRQARFKFRCNILISGKIINEMPGSVASGTRGIYTHTYCSQINLEPIIAA